MPLLVSRFWLRNYDSVTLLLQQLHWLKVEQRIEYQLAVPVYRCLHGLAPPYFADDLQRVADLGMRQRLRSASTHALVVPPFLRRGCPLLATVPFPGVEQSARFRHGVSVAAHVQATPEDCTVREKLLNTGCFRRLEHLSSHVIFCV